MNFTPGIGLTNEGAEVPDGLVGQVSVVDHAPLIRPPSLRF